MADTSTRVTNSAAFERGSLPIQIVLAVVTFGLYTIYWWYNTNKQFDEGTDADLNPPVQTVLFLIPPITLYATWKFANSVEDVLDQSAIVLFVLSIVFPPAFWFLVQSGINGLAE